MFSNFVEGKKLYHTSFNKELKNSSIDSLNYEHLYQHWKLMFPNFVGGFFYKETIPLTCRDW
jgi:hypothetical protein